MNSFQCTGALICRYTASAFPSPAPKAGPNPEWLCLLKHALEQLLKTCLGLGSSTATVHHNLTSYHRLNWSRQERYLSINSLLPFPIQTLPQNLTASLDNLLVSEKIKCSHMYTNYFQSKKPPEKGSACIPQPTQTFSSAGEKQSSASPVLPLAVVVPQLLPFQGTLRLWVQLTVPMQVSAKCFPRLRLSPASAEC